MIINPIIPLWLLIIITIILIGITINKNNIYHMIRQILIILFIFLIGIRFQVYNDSVKVEASNLDVILAVDTTLSMRAEDYDGENTRMDAIKKDLLNIIDSLGNTKYSLIEFDNLGRVKTPLSIDKKTLLTEIDLLETRETTFATGSTLNVLYDPLEEMLEASNKIKKDMDEDRKTIVLIFTDGEITNDKKLESFSELKKYIDSGYVLGYGSLDGGFMKGDEDDIFVDDYGYLEDHYSMEYPTPRAKSKIDEENLKQLSNDLGINYLKVDKHKDIDKVIKELKDITKSSKEETESYDDIYYYFVIPLIPLLMYEFVYFKRRMI